MTSATTTIARPSRFGPRAAATHRMRALGSVAPETPSITVAELSTEQYNRALADYLRTASTIGI